MKLETGRDPKLYVRQSYKHRSHLFNATTFGDPLLGQTYEMQTARSKTKSTHVIHMKPS